MCELQKPLHEKVYLVGVFLHDGDDRGGGDDHDSGNKANNERSSGGGEEGSAILLHSKSSIPNDYHNPKANDTTNPNTDHTKDHTMSTRNFHNRTDNKSMGWRR